MATLKPLDAATIVASVRKTGRCIIAHEAPLTGGFGGEIAARVAGEALLSLLAPIERVAGLRYCHAAAAPRAALPAECPRHRHGGKPCHGLRMSSFALPDLGEGLQEAELVAWHVAEGDHVVADQPLVSVETEKAVVEVPSPQAGRIARLIGKPGDRVKVGTPLVIFEEGAHADAGTVVGELGGKPTATSAAPLPAVASPGIEASPAVRAFARERGDRSRASAGHGTARHHYARRCGTSRGSPARRNRRRSLEGHAPHHGRQYGARARASGSGNDLG